MSLYEPDELFAVRSHFYSGAFDAALEELEMIVVDNPGLGMLCDSFKIRCLKACRRQVNRSAFKSIASPAIQALLISEGNSMSDQLDDLLAAEERSILADPLSRLMIGLQYESLGNYKSALNLVRYGDALEELATCARIYLKINRVDLAKSTVSDMETRDPDDVLTLLTSVSVLSSSRSTVNDASQLMNDLMQRSSETPLLLSIQASIYLKNEKFKEAIELLKKARMMERSMSRPASADILVNSITCLRHLRASMPTCDEIANRLVEELRKEYPNDQYVRDLDTFALLFDKVSVKPY